MFSKDIKPESFKEAETIIGESIKVKGNFQGQGNIVIEGFLEGSVKTEANLLVGAQAKIVANVEAKDAIINGELKGNIKAKNFLSIGKTAKIFGDIQYGEISIERGAVVNGQLLMIVGGNSRSENKRQAEGEDEEEK